MYVKVGDHDPTRIDGFRTGSPGVPDRSPCRFDTVGLALPGMPLGSPGMDGPAYDNRQDPYDVLLIHHDGSTTVFSSYFQTKRRS